MELYLYKFAKDFNSTKRPTDSDSKILVNGQARENMDVLRPSFLLLNTLTFEDFPAHRYNYAYIPQFDRYYYMTGAVWVRNAGWQCTFEVDALASYKTEIGASSQYVLRSESDFDGRVQDTFYPTISDCEIASVDISTDFKSNLSEGVYIVGIANGDSGERGGASYYVFTKSQLSDFFDQVFQSAEWFGDFLEGGDITADVVKMVVNPMQYIISCLWFPFGIGDVSTGDTVTEIPMGYWKIQATCLKLGAVSCYRQDYNVTLPKHPQQSRGIYLNSQPFTSYKIVFPSFGEFAIDCSELVNYNTLTLMLSVDYITGVGSLYVTLGDAKKVIRRVNSNFAVPLQLSQVMTDGVGMLGSLFSTGANVATEFFGCNPIGAAFSAVAGLGNIVANALPTVETSGTNGAISEFVFAPVLVATFYKVANEDNEHNGRPLCERRTINTLSGFIMCQNAEVPIRATVEEQETIRSKLETGFYYE